MNKQSKREDLLRNICDFHLSELTYIIKGNRPNHNYTLHKIFQHFNHDQDLATKLSDIVLQYEDANAANQDGWPALFVAVRFNQVKAIEYAARDPRFNFTVVAGPQQFTLMHLAVLKGNYKIIELLIDQNVSLFQENLEGIRPRSLAMQSPTNLKIIKRYELTQITKILIDKEDLSDTEDIPNTLKSMGTKENHKKFNRSLSIEPVIVKQSLQKQQIGFNVIKMLQSSSFNISFLANEWFRDRALSTLFKKMSQDEDPYLCSLMLCFIKWGRYMQFESKQIEDLVKVLELQIPIGQNTQSSETDIIEDIHEYAKDIKKQLNYEISVLRYKYKEIPPVVENGNLHQINLLKKMTSNKLQYDIRNYAHYPMAQNRVNRLKFFSLVLFELFNDPWIRQQSNILILQLYEQYQLVNLNITQY